MNDADVVMRTLGNFFCGPPYIPPPGFPSADPFLIQTNGSTSFLPVGSLGGAKGTSINDVGDVLGYYSGPGTGAHLVVWDNSGLHDLGQSGYGYMNNVGQVVYTGTNSGSILGFAMWQNGVSTPIHLPAGVSAQATRPINDAGQFIASNGQLSSDAHRSLRHRRAKSSVHQSHGLPLQPLDRSFRSDRLRHQHQRLLDPGAHFVGRG